MEEENPKRFPEWLELKETLDRVGRLTGISEGQIWWVAIGENVGVEMLMVCAVRVSGQDQLRLARAN